MANLLNGLAQQANPANSNDAYRQMQMMYTMQNTNPQTILGYKLGQLVSNYFDRSADSDMRKKLGMMPSNQTGTQPTTQPATAQQAATDQSTSGSAADTAFANQLIQNQIANAASAQKLADAKSSFEALNPSASPTGSGLLSGVGSSPNVMDALNSNGTVKTAADNSGNGNILGNLGTTIGGINAVSDLANGKANVLDLAKIAKIAGFFDNAPSSGKQEGATTDNSGSQQDVQQLVQQALAPTAQNATPLQAQDNLTPAQRLAAEKMHNDIVQLKSIYQQAQDKNDIAGMQDAHAKADMIRQTAQRLGLTTAAFGADDNLHQALTQKNTEDYNEQIRKIISPDPTSQQVYNQVYNKVRSLGGGYDLASKLASEQAQSYQSQRVQDLSNQFTQQGLSPTGAVNNAGAGILAQLLNESPQTYQALASMYAMPKNDYDFNNAVKMAVNNQALQKDLSGYNSGLRMNESDHNLGNTIKLNASNLANQMQLKQFEAKLSVQQKAALDQIALQTQGASMQQKYQIMYNAAKQFGADDTTAKNYALGTTVTGKKSMSPEMIAQLDAAKAIIADKQNWEKNNMDAATYPYETQYQQAMQLYNNMLSGGGNNTGSTSTGLDPNDYNSVMSDATDLLSKVTQNGGYSKQQIINGFEKRYGKEMAQAIANDIDWSQWGY